VKEEKENDWQEMILHYQLPHELLSLAGISLRELVQRIEPLSSRESIDPIVAQNGAPPDRGHTNIDHHICKDEMQPNYHRW